MTGFIKGATMCNVWDGIYSTWIDACEAVRREGEGGFNTANWLAGITQQLSDYRSQFTQLDVALPPRPYNLPIVCAMTSPKVICDLGGSSGWTWEYLKNTLKQQTISSYHIVELDSVVDFLKSSSLHSDVVDYSVLGAPLEQCDLLYSNSVLQYFESNSSLSLLIGRVHPTYIFLDDLIATEREEFFTTQSYYGTKIPCRFIGLKTLLQDMSDLGYQEIVRFPYLSQIRGAYGPLPMHNFPEEYRVGYAQSILLKKLASQ